MTDAEIKAKAAKAVREIQRSVMTLERSAISDSLRLLDDLRREVIARMAESGVSQFDLSTYRQIKASIDHAIADFERLLNVQITKDLTASFDLGERLVAEPLSVISAPLIGISRNSILIATSYSAELIQSLTAAAREKVNQVLRRAMLGALPVNDAIKAVGSNLDSSLTFKSIAARAETITRTEVLRMNSIAADARMKSSAAAVADLGWLLAREWDTAKDLRVREAHAEAQGQLRDTETPFEVDGEELQYPRDPNGSAENVINCRCSALPRLMRLEEFQRLMQEQEQALAA